MHIPGSVFENPGTIENSCIYAGNLIMLMLLDGTWPIF